MSKATAKQARFVAALERQIPADAFEEAVRQAYSVWNNGYDEDATTIQKVRKLTKSTASDLIDNLLDIKDRQNVGAPLTGGEAAPTEPEERAYDSCGLEIAVCAECGSDFVEANTWEAWCFDCDAYWTRDDHPRTFWKMRALSTDRNLHLTASQTDSLEAKLKALEGKGVKDS